MKKLFSIFMVAASVAMLFSSCKDKGGKNDMAPTVPMSPEEQQSFLENSLIDAVDVLTVNDAVEDIEAKFAPLSEAGNYSTDKIGEWFGKVLDDCMTEIESKVISESLYESNYYSGLERSVLDQRTLLALSSLYGHYYVVDNEYWKRSDADDLQVSFNDSEGKNCLVKVTSSKSVKNVHFIDDNYGFAYDERYDEEEGKYYYESTSYYSKYILAVPEWISLTYSYDGKEVVSVSVKFDLKNIKDEEIIMSSSTLACEYSMTLFNGMGMVYDMKYAGNKENASVGLGITMNGKNVIYYSVSVTPDCFPSDPFSDVTSGYAEENLLENVKVNSAKMKVDIMGKVQVVAEVPEIMAFIDKVDELDECSDNEKKFKSSLKELNGMYDASMYFNGDNQKQASVTLEAESRIENSMNPASGAVTKVTYWEPIPIVEFYDGSKSALLEDFINEEVFSRLLEKIDELLGEEEDM